MTIDWTHFTPWTSLAGGLLRPAPGEAGWRVAFLAGLVGTPLAWVIALARR